MCAPVLDGAWPHLAKALAAHWRAQLVPILDANKPSWLASLHLVRCGTRIIDEVDID